MKIFILDNHDSFTYLLKDYVEQCGAECIVRRNDDISLNEQSFDEYDAIIISPGPKTPIESGGVMEIISTYHQKKPILGVCLGHQAIGQFFGARLVKARLPRHGKVDLISHNQHALFKNIELSFEATRYHSLLLEEIEQPLEIIAWNKSKEIMAVAHNHLPLYGVQFHPESCMTKSGIVMIKNFLNLAKQLA